MSDKVILREGKLGRIFVHNQTEFEMNKVMPFVRKSIELGRISKTSKGDQFCFAVVTDVEVSQRIDRGDGGLEWQVDHGKICVYADRNKKSDRLTVTYEQVERINADKIDGS